jgi:hypothetical protein
MLATFALGVLIFIDDYFNCLTVGSVMRPVTDGHKISRAKFAYIIDATAAPICMIAPISSWAAAVTSVVGSENGLTYFVRAIPYNFYSLLTIVMIVAMALMKFDYGPMAEHERNAMNGDLFSGEYMGENVDQEVSAKGKVIDLVAPVLVLIAFCIIGMIYTGGFFDAEGDAYLNIATAFANADASAGLAWGALIAVIITILYLVARKVISARIPVAYLATVAVITFVFHKTDDALSWMLYSLFSGGVMLGAIFMATDYVTSPVTKRGQILYGIGCGILTVVFRYFGLFPEGVTYAILLMNALVWIIDRYTAPRRFGVKKGGK